MEEKLKKAYLKLSALNDSMLVMAQSPSATLHDNSWDPFNTQLKSLAEVTGDEHYQTLKITPTRVGSRELVQASSFSAKVYQAASYLYHTQEDDLSDFSPPQKPHVKSGAANNFTQTSVLSQDQKNDQEQHVEVNIEFNQTLTYMVESIVEARARYKEGTKERSFLDKLKDSIATAKTTVDLIKMIAAAAAQFGISAEALGQIFL